MVICSLIQVNKSSPHFSHKYYIPMKHFSGAIKITFIIESTYKLKMNLHKHSRNHGKN